jgi:pyruvate,water dikinase
MKEFDKQQEAPPIAEAAILRGNRFHRILVGALLLVMVVEWIVLLIDRFETVNYRVAAIGLALLLTATGVITGLALAQGGESPQMVLVVITAAFGLGETVVQGTVNPDEYLVFKPLLDKTGLKPIIEKSLGSKEKKLIYALGGTKATKIIDTAKKDQSTFVLDDDEILRLARWTVRIEEHYGRPMDIEWAKDGETGELFIVQARPETVQARKEADVMKTYRLKEKGEILLSGLSIGDAIAQGEVCLIKSAQNIGQFREGAILVTEMTDPDWVPIMKRPSGIVTDKGGRTCHAAIVSRELGVPAIVGTGEATQVLRDGQQVTISCAEGDQGYIYEGLLSFEATEVNLEDIPKTRTKIMMNIGSPAAAFRWWRLPCEGIGLARLEFIISNLIRIHPLALVKFEELKDREVKKQIEALTRGYAEKTDYFVENLARGIAKIAASQYPEPVIVRMSDFKTNEYANLIGGQEFEPEEENPMLGFRGASRYYSERFREAFALECRAIKKVREEIGLDNVIVMVPFCRTLKEADLVLKTMTKHGLKRGQKGLQVFVMAEIPSNIILATQFAKRFDGFSIGSNDLTQLTLGVDRDSGLLADIFDERDEAVKTLVTDLIAKAHQAKRKVGICGQAPSDYPEFAAFLVKAGIDSISLNPDSVVKIKQVVAKAEKKRTRG